MTARSVCRRHNRHTCDDALLLTSEVVTNAVVQRPQPGLRRGDRARRAAAHRGARRDTQHPTLVAEDPNALDGRGLALVDALAERWGVEDRPMGKAVWFEPSRT